MSFIYFAYGSNMLTERLRQRCPSARPIGTAVVPDHALHFTKPSVDHSGKATLVIADNIRARTPGVLFEIATSDLPNLDSAEGAGIGYDRHTEFEVLRAESSDPIKATTYLARETRSNLRPYDWYLALVIAGAHEHRLGAGYIRLLKQTLFNIDNYSDRIGRTQAIEALAAHGHHDAFKVLGPAG